MFQPQPKKWEFDAKFDPKAAEARRDHRKLRWVNHKGESTDGSTKKEGSATQCNLNDLVFRDPKSFKAGMIHQHYDEWKSIARQGDKHHDMVLEWVKNGVRLGDFMQRYSGDFSGESYDHDFPPSREFVNSDRGEDTIYRRHT